MRDLRMQFAGSKALFRLLALNIGFFLIYSIIRTLFFLSSGPQDAIQYFVLQLSLPALPQQLVVQPWSLLTYMFVHVDFLHLLFNMIVLFWTGKLFTEYLGNDKLWATYILGGLSGAVLFIVSYLLFPVLRGAAVNSHLIGASAGVIAVLVAIATLLPDYTVFLLIFGAVRLKYIAIASFILYFISIPVGNAGGHIAHIGGALFGFVFVRQLRNGRDLTAWPVRFANMLFSRRRTMKVVHKGPDSAARNHAGKLVSQEMIDQILDKINKSGFDSLTRQEKEILYRASEKPGSKKS